jgi:hypothetical protein
MKHPGHTYGGFVPAISERSMTPNPLSLKPIPFPRAPLLRSEPANRHNSHSRQDTVFSMSSPDRPATIRYPRPTKQSTPAPSSPWPPAMLPLRACIAAALPLAAAMLGPSHSRQAPAAFVCTPRHRLVRSCVGRVPALLLDGTHATTAWPPWHGISPPHLLDNRKWTVPCPSFHPCSLHAATSRWCQASLVPPC